MNRRDATKMEDNRFLRCAMEEKIKNSSSVACFTGDLCENRFLRCAMEHKTSEYEYERVVRRTPEEWYGHPRRQERVYRESVNDRVRRMQRHRQEVMAPTANLQNLQEFPPLSPSSSVSSAPSSPAQSVSSPTAPPSPLLKADWAEKVREAALKNAAASSAAKASQRPPVQQDVGVKESQNDTEEDIVFDEDGFPFLRMIESIDSSLTRR